MIDARAERKEHPARQECSPDGFRFFIENDLEKREIKIRSAKHMEFPAITLYGQEDANHLIDLIHSCIQEWNM
jgi:hypothetical protein